MPQFATLKHKIFSCVLVLIFFSTSLTLFAQIQQFGIVKQYRGAEEKTPLAGVEINVSNAASTISAGDGSFTLQFRTMHAGDLVNVRRIQKLGFEIFNKEALEQWIISGRKDIPFTIVMCPEDQFKKMRDTYERVSSANYEAQYRKEKVRLAQRQKEGRISLPDYENAMQKAEATLQQSKAQVSKVAEKFSRIDLSEVSKTEREVIALVQQGRIDQAVITAEKRGNMMHMAELYQLAGGVENLEKADSLLRKAAWSDTTQIVPMLKYAEFCYHRSDWYNATEAYSLCLRHIGQSRARRAGLAFNLGLLYTRLNDPIMAQEMFDLAESDMLDLHDRDAEGWLPALVSVWSAQGTTQLNGGRMQSAIDHYQKVFDECEKHLRTHGDRQDVLRQLLRAGNNIGIAHIQAGNYSQAQKVLNMVLIRSQKLENGQYETAAICHTMGNLFMMTNHLPEAESRLKMCERLLLPLMARNPQAIMADMATCYHSLFRVCNMQEGRLVDGLRYLDTAIAQYNILAERYPKLYQSKVELLQQQKQESLQ